jgi:hypothetical protein
MMADDVVITRSHNTSTTTTPVMTTCDGAWQQAVLLTAFFNISTSSLMMGVRDRKQLIAN